MRGDAQAINQAVKTRRGDRDHIGALVGATCAVAVAIIGQCEYRERAMGAAHVTRRVAGAWHSWSALDTALMF